MAKVNEGESQTTTGWYERLMNNANLALQHLDPELAALNEAAALQGKKHPTREPVVLPGTNSCIDDKAAWCHRTTTVVSETFQTIHRASIVCGTETLNHVMTIMDPELAAQAELAAKKKNMQTEMEETTIPLAQMVQETLNQTAKTMIQTFQEGKQTTTKWWLQVQDRVVAVLDPEVAARIENAAARRKSAKVPEVLTRDEAATAAALWNMYESTLLLASPSTEDRWVERGRARVEAEAKIQIARAAEQRLVERGRQRVMIRGNGNSVRV